MSAQSISPSMQFNSLARILARNRPWHRIAVVFAGNPDRSDLVEILTVARMHDAKILLYDIAASDGFTSPYPPGEENWLPTLLFEADLHRVGREDLAVLAQELANEGLFAGVYLVPKSKADDLAAVVSREGIELVVSLLPGGDRRASRVLTARRSAHVVSRVTTEDDWTMHPLMPESDPQSTTEQVRLPYLFLLVVTFLFARLRNRS